MLKRLWDNLRKTVHQTPEEFMGVDKYGRYRGIDYRIETKKNHMAMVLTLEPHDNFSLADYEAIIKQVLANHGKLDPFMVKIREPGYLLLMIDSQDFQATNIHLPNHYGKEYREVYEMILNGFISIMDELADLHRFKYLIRNPKASFREVSLFCAQNGIPVEEYRTLGPYCLFEQDRDEIVLLKLTI